MYKFIHSLFQVQRSFTLLPLTSSPPPLVFVAREALVEDGRVARPHNPPHQFSEVGDPHEARDSVPPGAHKLRLHVDHKLVLHEWSSLDVRDGLDLEPRGQAPVHDPHVRPELLVRLGHRGTRLAVPQDISIEETT